MNYLRPIRSENGPSIEQQSGHNNVACSHQSGGCGRALTRAYITTPLYRILAMGPLLLYIYHYYGYILHKSKVRLVVGVGGGGGGEAKATTSCTPKCIPV